MDNELLKVVSIFYSIQGEGTFTGTASVFIRLFGCNLECDFCDDDLHKGNFENLNFLEILEKIKKYPSKNLIITGGEPSLYNLNNFIKFLQSKGYFVAVESNGFCFENIKSANWITYSPKNLNLIKKEGFDELKFIVDKNTNIQKILDLKVPQPIFIQPKNYKNSPNFEAVNFCLEVVLKYPHLKLSVQLHKFLNID
jgi:organic radical activating enzyme